ncbi:MAG: amino acid permease [Rickettsiales bacterium]|nr:amino acid permease [Rickettsiales bacterium]
MQKKIGSIMLVAGTCIGSGMIALPMVLAKLGLVLSIVLMLSIWVVMYYTSLIHLELNLQAGRGLSLGELGKRYSGKIAEMIGVSSIKLLSYSLLSAYIYGGSSLLQKMFDTSLSQSNIAIIYTFIITLMLLFPIKWIDYINRLLFVGAITTIAILILGLVTTVNWTQIPMVSASYVEISSWRVAIPIVFTSFGFQVIFHTLTNYCNRDSRMLKKVFFWGSLIPAITYIIWTCSLLGVLYNKNPAFYKLMIAGQVDVGELIKELTILIKWRYVQVLIWWISLLAIITSVLGVSVGLCESLRKMLTRSVPNIASRNVFASVLTLFPACLVAIVIPHAFISALSFAGMILVVIAILLPIYLLYKAKITSFYYYELKYKWPIVLSIIIGMIVISVEIFNMVI